MNWIDSLERKFGRLAVPGLMRYVAALNVLVFILWKLNPNTFLLLDLNARAVLQGEVWRLVTYIFIPTVTSFIPTPDWFNAAMWTYFLWWIGEGVEDAWGPFKLNLFYLLGMIGTTVAAFFFGGYFSNTILNMSVFFAFARYYPDVVIYAFYVLPIKVRWMAWMSAAGLFYLFFRTGSMSLAAAMLVSLVNYLIFFGPEIWREAGHRTEVAQRRRRFEQAKADEDEAMHHCKVCNRTEITNPDLEFRVSSDGNEYCTEHLPAKNPAR